MPELLYEAPLNVGITLIKRIKYKRKDNKIPRLNLLAMYR